MNVRWSVTGLNKRGQTRTFEISAPNHGAASRRATQHPYNLGVRDCVLIEGKAALGRAMKHYGPGGLLDPNKKRGSNEHT